MCQMLGGECDSPREAFSHAAAIGRTVSLNGNASTHGACLVALHRSQEMAYNASETPCKRSEGMEHFQLVQCRSA